MCHATVQMDFAENFVCDYGEEIKRCIHPMAVHYRAEADGPLLHTSFVGVCGEKSHTAGTIFAFMKKLIAQIKVSLPSISTVHYLTDSPTSQYRSRHIINITAHHANIFGMQCSWQYFEAGHGKGPCDGVGGSVKRSASTAIKSGRVIQGAVDFFEWAQTHHTKVKYIYLAADDMKEAQQEMEALQPLGVPGTIALHSVVPIRKGAVYAIKTSCMRECCFKRSGAFEQTCSGWTLHTTTGQKESTPLGLPSKKSKAGLVLSVFYNNISYSLD